MPSSSSTTFRRRGNAAPVWTQVLAESEALKLRLYEDPEELKAHWVGTEADTLVRDLAEAGRMLHEAREADRRQLWLELNFWAGVRRMATGVDSLTPELNPFGERLEVLAAAPFVTQATAGDGVVEFEVHDLSWNGVGQRFVARGCRVHGGSLNGQLGAQLRLTECSLLHVSIEGTPAVLDLAHARVCGHPERPSTLHVTVDERFDAASTVMRFVTVSIELTKGATADFSDAELASQRHRDQVELVSLAGIEREPGARDGGAVQFRDCVLPGASFVNAALQDVWFENCDLRDADFSGANLDGAQFDERCQLAGARTVGAVGVPPNVDIR